MKDRELVKKNKKKRTNASFFVRYRFLGSDWLHFPLQWRNTNETSLHLNLYLSLTIIMSGTTLPIDWNLWSDNSSDFEMLLLKDEFVSRRDLLIPTLTPTLPIDMTFNDGHIVSIATYSVLLVISVCGNVTVLVNLTGRKHVTNPRVSIMLIHLAIADLLVSVNLLLRL